MVPAFVGVFICRGKEDALVTKNMVIGESVYGEKRINVEVSFLQKHRFVFIPLELTAFATTVELCSPRSDHNIIFVEESKSQLHQCGCKYYDTGPTGS